jgi:hypothetical protein
VNRLSIREITVSYFIFWMVYSQFSVKMPQISLHRLEILNSNSKVITPIRTQWQQFVNKNVIFSC